MLFSSASPFPSRSQTVSLLRGNHCHKLFVLLQKHSHTCMSTGRHTSFVMSTWDVASVAEVLGVFKQETNVSALLHSTEYWKYLCSLFWAGSMQASWLQLKSVSIYKQMPWNITGLWDCERSKRQWISLFVCLFVLPTLIAWVMEGFY